MKKTRNSKYRRKRKRQDLRRVGGGSTQEADPSENTKGIRNLDLVKEITMEEEDADQNLRARAQ